jgi:hypothetical protein
MKHIADQVQDILAYDTSDNADMTNIVGCCNKESQ